MSFWRLCNILIYPPLTHLPLVTWGPHAATQDLAVTRTAQMGGTYWMLHLNTPKILTHFAGWLFGRKKRPCSWWIGTWELSGRHAAGYAPSGVGINTMYREVSVKTKRIYFWLNHRLVDVGRRKKKTSFTPLRLLRSIPAWRESRNEPNLLIKFRLWLWE